MKPKTRHYLSVGLFVPAIAFGSAAMAQSSGTSQDNSAERSSSAYGGSVSPGTGAASPNTSGNRSSTTTPRDSSTASSGSSTATPSGSAAASSDSSTMSTAPRGSSTASGAVTGGAGSATASDSARSSSSAAGGERAQASSDADTAKQAHSMRASKIIGKDVHNAQGEKLGEIEDLVVDTTGERVQYAVLSHGGILGIGDKLFAYPMDRFQARADADDRGKADAQRLVLDVSKEQLENAPGFASNKWPDFSDGQYSGQVDKHFGTESRSGDQANRKFVRASELIGKNIDDRAGKDAGEVEDLIVDLSNGRVQFAVIDFDDSWAKDSDGKLVAIPLKSLTMPGDKDGKLVLAESQDSIDMTHAFQENQWPDFSDPAWRDRSTDQRASLNR